MNPRIFREYDVRGVVDEDLTDEVVENLGWAYGSLIRDEGGHQVVVGRDVRLSSPRLLKALCKGILKSGCDVTDVGEVPTPVLYFSILRLEMDGGVMITGSHNPLEYNGFKLCLGIASIYGEGIQRLRARIEKGDFVRGSGSMTHKDTLPSYMEALTERIVLSRGLKVVLDAGNGGASRIAPELFRRLGCEVIPLYCEIDGRFPNHLPDPTVPKFLVDLQRKVLETGADVGIGYDGDADRIGVIDDEGKILYGDRLLALYARDVLSRKPGSPIIFDVKCSQALVEDIEAHGGRPLMGRTGHSLIKARMKAEAAPLAGEMSGHMFFADEYFGYDDALYASARLARILADSPEKLSRIAAGLPQYVATPEIRIVCSDEEKFGVVEAITEHFRARYEVLDVDGVRVLFGDGWGLVRASNTQPVLVLRFEASTQKRLEEIARTILEELKRHPAVSGIADVLRSVMEGA
ncbi:MAG: phosphomannomutase/phosphoglucomutase [Candidatus Latescibacterota bacterium]